VVWSEPNMSQIEAWSSTIYAWYQEFEFEFEFEFFLNFKRKNFKKKLQKFQIKINFLTRLKILSFIKPREKNVQTV
jgi:hypothetical protein